MNETIRTFIATPVLISDTIGETLMQLKDDLREEVIKWVDFSQLHITISFLGDINREWVGEISDSLEQELSVMQEERVEINGLKIFGSKRDPRVIWMGISGLRFYETLKSKVDNATRQFIVKEDNRPFKPHLTIGRVKFLRDHQNFNSRIEYYSNKILATAVIDRVIFYKSELQKIGPIYRPLRVINLK